MRRDRQKKAVRMANLQRRLLGSRSRRAVGNRFGLRRADGGFTPLERKLRPLGGLNPVRDKTSISNGVKNVQRGWPLKPHLSFLTGFTIIEVLLVVVIISIAAMMVVPMFSSADSMQLRSAANMIAADLEYAKSMAISRGQNFSVMFDESADSYRIEDQGGVVIAHPVKRGFDYDINLQNERLGKVDIAGADFDSESTITFDYLGSPYSGTGIAKPLNSGVITLQSKGTGAVVIRVGIEPITGFISISD